MAKKKDVVPVFVDNVEALEAKMQAMREAQKIFATYTQEQVDKIFFWRKWRRNQNAYSTCKAGS